MPAKEKKQWSKDVKTDSTHPAVGLFTKDPQTIAESLASKEVSPQGPASGLRMLTFYINRAGRGLSASRKRTLEKAKKLLSARVDEARKEEQRRKFA
jgi:tRNA(adenine34) deaminase